MSNDSLYMGVDIGSVSLKTAILCDPETDLSALQDYTRIAIPSHAVWLSPYIRHLGSPVAAYEQHLAAVEAALSDALRIYPSFTGKSARMLAEQFGRPLINEFRASAEAVGRLYPHVETIFEMGGETSRFIRLSRLDGQIQISDYEKNGDCAAGTGLFFDQQAERMKYRVEEVGELVRTAKRTANIAGRCSVFAKSDMIHAQQRGYRPEEILKGLCDAVVRNYKGTITKGKTIDGHAAFIGGLAANIGVVQSVRDIFNLKNERLTVPEHHAWMGAIGAALIGSGNGKTVLTSPIIPQNSHPKDKPLSLEKVRLLRNEAQQASPAMPGAKVYLGVDIGSVSTNLALIDEAGQLIHGIYRMTEGRPIEIVTDAFRELTEAVGENWNIRGVGTTGSGRELIGLLIGADVIKDEITAHKTGAMHISKTALNRSVDTIFEIGGQDSKYISIRDGVVTDFTMNDACAAGTGSFLEEQANHLGISIKGEFAKLALSSAGPLKLGERCTVFMEKEMIPYLRRGVSKSDICAGLALSVVHNYLNRVVKKRPIGDTIFFQGGTAFNDAVAAAFATVLEKEIIVPPHNGIMGAIGAALLAKQSAEQRDHSTFRGWDLSRVQWNLREFTCRACSNHCVIQEFDIEGEKSHWGDKCSDRYRKQSKSAHRAEIENLYAYRASLLIPADSGRDDENAAVGIPRALQFYDRLPFWSAYFEALGYSIRLSDQTRQTHVHHGVEATVADPCFPVQVFHGHLDALLKEDVDCIFMPNLVNEIDPGETIGSFICPWAQTAPLVAKHSPKLTELEERLYDPNVQFRLGQTLVEASLFRQLSERIRIDRRLHRQAVNQAYASQKRFRSALAVKGESILFDMAANEKSGIVLVGRPYNLYDMGLNLNIPGKLREHYGMNVIPMDFLPLDDVDISDIHDHMFWSYGRRILQACRWTRDHAHLEVIYLSNFKCGPDSYIRHFVGDALGRPLLFLQLDSHSNDAGVMTRIEAFLESKNML